MAWVVLRSIRW